MGCSQSMNERGEMNKEMSRILSSALDDKYSDKEIISSIIHDDKLIPKSQRFSTLYIDKKQENLIEFILKINSNESNEIGGNSITVSLKIYQSPHSFPAFKFKLKDSNKKINKRVLESKSGKFYTLKIIAFNSYEDFVFKQCLHQIFILQKVEKLKNPNIGFLF